MNQSRLAGALNCSFWCSTYHSSSKEEIVFVHIELSCSFQYFRAHLEREQQLVAFKQTTACKPEQELNNLNQSVKGL